MVKLLTERGRGEQPLKGNYNSGRVEYEIYLDYKEVQEETSSIWLEVQK